jgi:hypothetical protein
LSILAFFLSLATRFPPDPFKEVDRRTLFERFHNCKRSGLRPTSAQQSGFIAENFSSKILDQCFGLACLRQRLTESGGGEEMKIANIGSTFPAGRTTKMA